MSKGIIPIAPNYGQPAEHDPGHKTLCHVLLRLLEKLIGKKSLGQSLCLTGIPQVTGNLKESIVDCVQPGIHPWLRRPFPVQSPAVFLKLFLGLVRTKNPPVKLANINVEAVDEFTYAITCFSGMGSCLDKDGARVFNRSLKVVAVTYLVFQDR